MRPRETTAYEEDVIEAFKKRMILTMPELKAMPALLESPR